MDEVALARLGPPVEPMRLEPERGLRGGRVEERDPVAGFGETHRRLRFFVLMPIPYPHLPRRSA